MAYSKVRWWGVFTLALVGVSARDAGDKRFRKLLVFCSEPPNTDGSSPINACTHSSNQAIHLQSDIACCTTRPIPFAIARASITAV